MHNQPKLLLVFFLSIISPVVHSQTTWAENFSDSNFTANPEWTGATTDFIVNGQKKLQLNAAPATANSSLATASKTAIKGTWEFFVALDFNPSSSNFAQVFVLSSSANTSNTNGYFVQIGGTTDDKISLYKKTGSTNTLLAASQNGLVNTANVHVRIKVERDSLHNWILFADTSGGSNLVQHGTAIDSTYTNSNFFVLNCVYSSTRADKFFFDNILVNGAQIIDAKKPKITAYEFLDDQNLTLTFSETVDSASATKVGNFTLGGISNSISSVFWTAAQPDKITIQFQNQLLNSQNFTLFVEAVEDISGNEMMDTTLAIVFFQPIYLSVVFNEIMADPSPTVGLPDAEYVELYNATAYPVNLNGWHFLAGADDFTLPNYIMPAHSMVLLVANANAQLFGALPHIALPASTSFLTNSGEELWLRDEKGVLIDGLTYDINLHSNPAKRDGGWSFEIIDGLIKCYDTENWCSSASQTGGTPGTWNSPEKQWQNRDSEVLTIEWLNSSEVILRFTQGLNVTHRPVIKANVALANIAFSNEQPNEALITFSTPIGSQSVTLFVESALSCNGKYVADTLTFSAPQMPEAGDVVINEILFNPKGDAQDFVEIWNTSAKTILLGNLRLANVDASGNVTNQFALGTENALLLPGEFLVVGEERAALCAQYSCAKRRFYSESATPSMPDAEGNIALTDAALQVLEQVNYSENWHHQLITNQEGVSLERIQPAMKSNEATSWHSAASAVNYATPGRVNSQFSGNAAGQGSISVQSSTVSPNNDGQNDVLLLSYNLPQSAVLSVVIFGINGVQMATIADQLLTENSGQLTWDGTTENGQLAASGIYIVLAEWFTPSGEKGIQKLNIVVSR